MFPVASGSLVALTVYVVGDTHLWNELLTSLVSSREVLHRKKFGLFCHFFSIHDQRMVFGIIIGVMKSKANAVGKWIFLHVFFISSSLFHCASHLHANETKHPINLRMNYEYTHS